MKPLLNMQTFKMLGGALIVAGAFAIMFPGLEAYVGSLLRLGIFITVCLVVALVVTLTITKIRSASRKIAVQSSQTEAKPADSKVAESSSVSEQ